MSKAMIWLLRYQNSDGSFREPGRVIHSQMQGGSFSGARMSAFILISLLENRNVSTVQGTDVTMAIRNAATYLEAELNYVRDSYSLAIICYALASANRPSRSTCHRKLKTAAFHDDDKTYWKANYRVTKREVGDRALRNRAPSMDVEASSYALLFYMKLGYYAEAFPIVKWLVSQRNPTGGQRSTQDTVISIQALAEFATYQAATPGPEYGVFFELSDGGKFNHVYNTKSSTFDIVHTFEVPNDVDTFVIQATGSGSAVIDVSTSYYVTGTETDDNIQVYTRVKEESINSVTIHPCLRWAGRNESGMLLMEVQMPTGFQSDNNILNIQNKIKKHETNGRNIALYFNGVNPNTDICVLVKMDRVDPVVKSQACHVKAYDYYDPAHQAITRYEFGLLKEPNICKICPLCGFCNTGEAIGVGR
ncbi:CD109 antigen-like [Ruditapes philippinarum]|uniref:CD109 antigen-like n=1 Tax=Ruditapes philippinarum TaxID=129788 RepID=UPI00295AC2AD|nr:CD109 antigen-like [Ruditapes philippinarum]